jgi:hypothetical protein
MKPSEENGTLAPGSVPSSGEERIITSPPEEVGDLTSSASSFIGEEHHQKTASKLAYAFSIALFVVFLLHTFIVYLFARRLQPEPALEAIGHVFSTWIPVFSGIVSAAVTYYFTQNRRQ